MGVNHSWIAVQDTDRQAVLQRLGFIEVGSAETEFAGPPVCGVTQQGWVLVVSRRMKLDLKALPARAASQATALVCERVDTANYGRLAGWRDGREIWSIEHNPEDGVDDLAVTGSASPELTPILAELRARQAADPDADSVDYMLDATPALAKALCGYDAEGPPPILWTEIAPARPNMPVGAGFASVLREELMPELLAQGWTSGPEQPGWEGGRFDVARVRDGRLQALKLIWSDDRRKVDCAVRFVIYAGAVPSADIVVSGRAAGPPRPGLMARLSQIGKARPYPDALAEAKARVRRDIAVVETFLQDGEVTAGVELDR